jgi:hypothetical protein
VERKTHNKLAGVADIRGTGDEPVGKSRDRATVTSAGLGVEEVVGVAGTLGLPESARKW